jgi:hypothetical protein
MLAVVYSIALLSTQSQGQNNTNVPAQLNGNEHNKNKPCKHPLHERMQLYGENHYRDFKDCVCINNIKVMPSPNHNFGTRCVACGEFFCGYAGCPCKKKG